MKGFHDTEGRRVVYPDSHSIDSRVNRRESDLHTCRCLRRRNPNKCLDREDPYPGVEGHISTFDVRKVKSVCVY